MKAALNLKPPSPNQLRGYLLGTLPLSEFDEVDSWVEREPRSAAMLNAIAAHDSVTSALTVRRAIVWDDGSVDAILRQIQEVRDPTIAPSWSAPKRAIETYLRYGPYQVVEELARGGMGVVYKAWDDQVARHVAVKVPNVRALGDPAHRERFFREARIAAKIRSDHIVTIHQVGEQAGQPYLVMELLPGSTLENWLQALGKPPELDVSLRIIRELLAGLAAAHEQGLIHRDIKPSNLWIEEKTNRLKLLDFGLGRELTADSEATEPGEILGTPAYMAPEQTMGKPLDERADLFSAGAAIYRMLSGNSPFQRDNALATMCAVANIPLDPAPNAPPPLQRFLDRLLSKDPEGRPSNAIEALREWEQVEADCKPRVDELKVPTTVQPSRTPTSRWRTWIIVDTVALTALALLAIIVVIRWKNEDGSKGKALIVASDKSASISLSKSKPASASASAPTQTQTQSQADSRSAKLGRVKAIDNTYGYLDDKSDQHPIHLVNAGEQGALVRYSQSHNRALVKWDSNQESWVSRDRIQELESSDKGK